MKKSFDARHRKAVKKALHKRFGYVVGSKYFSLYDQDFGMKTEPIWWTLRRFIKDYDQYKRYQKYKAQQERIDRIWGKYPKIEYYTDEKGNTSVSSIRRLAKMPEIENVEVLINSPGGMIGTDFPPAESIVTIGPVYRRSRDWPICIDPLVLIAY